MSDAIQFFWRLSVVAEMALAVRLLSQGLAGSYPALLAGSCIFALRSTLLMFLLSRPLVFSQNLWRATEPVEWAVCAWIVFELFTHWTRNYRGIGRFGNILLIVFLIVAIGISIAISPVEWQHLVWAGDLRRFYVATRAVKTALALFMIGTVWFFNSHPAPVPSNVRYHTRILVFYLTSTAIAGLIINILGVWGTAAYQWVNLGVVVATAFSFSLWGLMLTREGRVKAGGPQPPTPAERADIERINDQLLELMRNFGWSRGGPR